MACGTYYLGRLLLLVVCMKASHDVTSEASRSLLQIKRSEPEQSCPLPEGGQWAEVRLTGLPAFEMAVRSNSDALSQKILEEGHWEVADPSIWGPPGEALDIGGNIGYYTFAMANAGWHVTTFEPMDINTAFIEATLCRNPALAERVKLLKTGLGAQDQICMMNADKNNIGNAVFRCTEADENTHEEWSLLGYVQTGSFPIRRLEDVLREQQISKVDFIKIDAEGYECEIFKGAGGPNFLSTYKPRLIKSEVWKDMERCTSMEYFAMFENTGYRLGMDADPACKDRRWTQDAEWANLTKFWAADSNFYMCRDDY